MRVSFILTFLNPLFYLKSLFSRLVTRKKSPLKHWRKQLVRFLLVSFPSISLAAASSFFFFFFTGFSLSQYLFRCRNYQRQHGKCIHCWFLYRYSIRLLACTLQVFVAVLSCPGWVSSSVQTAFPGAVTASLCIWVSPLYGGSMQAARICERQSMYFLFFFFSNFILF